MRKLLNLLRTSRVATGTAVILIAVVAFAPAALSGTWAGQQLQVAGQPTSTTIAGPTTTTLVPTTTTSTLVPTTTTTTLAPTTTTTTLAPTTTTTTLAPTTTTTTLAPTTTTTTLAATTTTVGNRPAGKDFCKKGGWDDYGVFKNQGDCVSWVATGGSNPPAG